jgi:hypothetical protein
MSCIIILNNQEITILNKLTTWLNSQAPSFYLKWVIYLYTSSAFCLLTSLDLIFRIRIDGKLGFLLACSAIFYNIGTMALNKWLSLNDDKAF